MLHINNNNPQYHQSISDLGGQRILGMGGSLRGYIETGNQYDKAYFKGKTRRDEVKECQKQKDRNFLKGFATAGIIIGGIAGAVSLFKKGGSVSGAFKLAKDGIVSGWNKLKGCFTKTPTPPGTSKATKVKDFFIDKGSKAKKAICTGAGEVKKFFCGIGSKIAGFFKKKP